MNEPDYSGWGIANLMASVTDALGAADAPAAVALCPALPREQLAAARHVVLLVIDGLGSAQLAQHAGDGHIAGARVAELSSVFPTTTASAVSTYMTGDAPITHGLTGWHVLFGELGVIGAPLPFRVRGGDVALSLLGANARQLFQTRPVSARLTRRSVMIHPQSLCDTEYTRTHAGPAEIRPYTSLEGMVEAIGALAVESEPSYCYAYWPQLDTLSHIHGSHSDTAGDHLRELDEAIGRCARNLRGTGSVLMVCADHGFVDTDEDTRLELADYPDLADTLSVPLCGEPRMVYCYVRCGAENEFLAIAAEQLGHAAKVVSAEQVLQRGWLGPGPQHPRVAERIGSHVLVMKERYCLTDRVIGETRPFRQIGVHGGLSDAELRVPLSVWAG